jgi:hypothetical protein
VKRGRDPIAVVRSAKANQLIQFPTITDSKREVWKGR